MPDALSFVPGLVGAGGALGVGYAFAKWIIEYIGGRMDKRADRLDAGTQVLIDQLRSELDRMGERLETADSRLDRAFNEISDLRDELAECQKCTPKPRPERRAWRRRN